jgi:hypothetical protein
MPRSDRLLELAGCHGVLRHHNLRSLDAYRAATPDHLRQLHRYQHEIRRLVEQAHPDVMAALWPPKALSWQVALLATEPDARLLSVWRGELGGSHETVLSLTYSASDPASEREAWRALVAALGGSNGGVTSS